MNDRAENKSRRESKRLFVTMLTLVRMPLAIAFAIVLLAVDEPLARTWAGLSILIVIELSDLLDGVLARRLNVVTERGAMLDPLADSFSRLTVYWALAVSGLVLAFVPLVMALRDIIVAYARITLAQRKRSVSAKRSGKIKAMTQALGALLLVAPPLYEPWVGTWPMLPISWIVAVVTAASCIEYVHAAVASMPKPNG